MSVNLLILIQQLNLTHLMQSPPVVRHVCDSTGGEQRCFLAALVPNQRSGPSAQVLQPGGWSDSHLLLPLMQHVLGNSCRLQDGRRKLVIDVGANVGLYSLYFALRGCIVHAFEPVPVNAEALMLSSHLNKLQDRIVLHHVAVTMARTPANATEPRAKLRLRVGTHDTAVSRLHLSPCR